jgi:hypothetical protein
MEIEVDFKQLLEDITYTNKIMKTFDVKDIITRGQYYQLKDSIVLWLMKHNITKTDVDGFEFFFDKSGNRMKLVRLTISYGDTKCLIHQHNCGKIKNIVQDILDERKQECEISEYIPNKYDGLELDKDKFIDAISRMKVVRILFIRESLPKNEFDWCYETNRKSSNPWMKEYRVFLPLKGNADLIIKEKICTE